MKPTLALPLLPLLFHLALPLAALPALAQAGPATVVPGAAPIPADDRLYQALGGREAIQRFTDDFYDSMLQDARIARFFDGLNPRYLKRVLADYFCVVAGGPCVYDGVGMKDAHAHLGLAKRDFNALVEHLQLAMDRAHVPFSTQNELLARLAPAHRDIVTR
jgi:hemoglobin